MIFTDFSRMNTRSLCIRDSISDLSEFDEFQARVLHTFNNDGMATLLDLTTVLRDDQQLFIVWKDIKNILQKENDIWNQISRHWHMDVVRAILPMNSVKNGGDRKSKQYNYYKKKNTYESTKTTSSKLSTHQICTKNRIRLDTTIDCYFEVNIDIGLLCFMQNFLFS